MGKRNTSAEVELLNRNIEGMSARIRQLEDALHSSRVQSSEAGTPSPSPQASNYDLSILSFASVIRGNSDRTMDSFRRAHILNKLPSVDQARSHIDTFFSNCSWMMSPVSRLYCLNVLFPRCYTVPCTASSPELSALLAIFAVATAGDGSLGIHQTSSEFYELSLEALQLHDTLNSQDIATVEAMALQSCFLSLLWDGDDLQKAWNYTGMTARLTYAMGLHQDPELQGQDDEECLRRRRLFHEVISLDIWQSILFERPPSVHTSATSTDLPHDTFESLGTDPSFFQWKYQFCQDVLVAILNEVVCAQEPPAYSRVLELDKRARECMAPTNLQFVDVKSGPIELILQAQGLNLLTEVALCRLHKDSFLLALEESPNDPFQHLAGHSVSTILYYTMTQLKRLRVLTAERPEVFPGVKRTWEMVCTSIWYLSTFLKCVKVGPTAERVYMEFELGCKLLNDQADDSERSAKLMHRVAELRQTVLQNAPHLRDGLRNTLSRMKWQNQPTGDEPVSAPDDFDLALEYPLGTREEGSHVGSDIGSSSRASGQSHFDLGGTAGNVYMPVLPPIMDNYKHAESLSLESVDPYLAAYFGMQEPSPSTMDRGGSMEFTYDSDPDSVRRKPPYRSRGDHESQYGP
ncbi:hypothetical protein FRC17_004859 [Serendipita sp. 399]|nr:hypothetical protein FRC17_004859 [Serendipita sp. 399]